jgi:hypothetical protein
LPTSSCGHKFRNSLVIPSVGSFELADDDITVVRGTEGSKSINLKLGSFTDSIGAIRVEYKISLSHVTKTIYDAIKTFAQTDLLQGYLLNYTGSINLNFSGEAKNGCVIKSIQTSTSAIMPSVDGIAPEVEYIEKVDLTILAPSYQII